MKNKLILIGILDYNMRKNEKSSYMSNYAMCYSAKGNKWPDKAAQGNGFEQGDIVEVKVDRPNRTVHYFVNGILKANHTHAILGQKTPVLTPYVEMYDADDAVEWLID